MKAQKTAQAQGTENKNQNKGILLSNKKEVQKKRKNGLIIRGACVVQGEAGTGCLPLQKTRAGGL